MIDWYFSLNLGIQVLIGVVAFLLGQMIIVFLFSLLQLFFVKYLRKLDK